MTIPRSSTESLATTHCPAAARHQELGTPRDRAGMAVGVAVHHLVHAVINRDQGVLADVAIDQCAVGLVSEGRSFDGGPVEYLSTGDVDKARDRALDFLDRDVIPERGDVDWMEGELLVALDWSWKRVDREMCHCGHADHGAAQLVCFDGSCDCMRFDPVAIWQQALDLAVTYQDEIDDEEVMVAEVTDWRGGNCSTDWFRSLQGKGAAVAAVALFPEADIVRRRVISYMRWGGRYEEDLDLRQQEDLDTLEDYRRSIEVASAGAKARQGRTPDELATPGAGCSAGFLGCPWLLKCKPFAVQWNAINCAWGMGGQILGVADWASMYALAVAVQQEAAKRVKVALVDTGSVLTVDGGSLVGWKQKKAQKVTDNAAALLSREWVESVMNLAKGSPQAQLEQARMEALLMNALPKKGGSGIVKKLVKRLKEVIGWEEAAALEALCLEPDDGRMLKTWKADKVPVTAKKEPLTKVDDLMGLLKRSLK